ncbi:MAG: hypothetical protein RL115_663 [Bacteroidota bacterium]|jgi:hypothetical protein
MKKIGLLLIATTIATVGLFAQKGKWKVCLNKKTLLETTQEDASKNVRTISLKEWNKNGYLELQYKETEKDIWFYRHFMIVDKDETDFYRIDSANTIKIPLAALRKKTAGKKEIYIYTTISPKDPTLAIRIRRVHLVTLKVP